MKDCDDPRDDAPDTTLAGLVDEFEAAAEAFRADAQQNKLKREAAEPVAEYEGLLNQEEFVAQPYLVVSHYSDETRRPVTQRSDLSPNEPLPLNSEALSVTTTAGERVTAISPDETHRVDCTVRNLGGVAAKSVQVELYVEHKTPDATVDTVGGKIELPLSETDSMTMTGVTTMAPGSQVWAFAHMPEVDLVGSEILDHSGIETVAADRTFSLTLDGKPDTFLQYGKDVPDDKTDFEIKLFDVTATPDEMIEDPPDSQGIYAEPVGWEAIPLATIDGEYVANPSRGSREDYDLVSSVPASETTPIGDTGGGSGSGTQYTSIPANSERTVTFEYTPTRAEMPTPNEGLADDEFDPYVEQIDFQTNPGYGRAISVFYARTYAREAAETPENWDDLDHVTSRFMGRTERQRDIWPAEDS